MFYIFEKKREKLIGQFNRLHITVTENLKNRIVIKNLALIIWKIGPRLNMLVLTYNINYNYVVNKKKDVTQNSVANNF